MRRLVFLLCLVLLDSSVVLAASAAAEAVEVQKRGRYLFRLAGCKECHTQDDGPLLAGGRALETPFGTFYSPNITSHPTLGIGSWNVQDLRRALRHGQSPDGAGYYPVFPYPSYTGISDDDISDLWAYLRTIPAVARPNDQHDLKFPFSRRELMWGWQLLFFNSGPFVADTGQSEQWNRGAYLVRSLGHCGECHSPRNLVGVVDNQRELGGNRFGPDGLEVPNITPDQDSGIGSWSASDVSALLEMGMLPDADFVGAGMAAVVDNSTGYLTEPDRRAVVEFLQQLSPIYNPDFVMPEE